jgi:Ca-activated chloride channel family protein
VQAWRLLGYENRVLASEDFQDDRKDAGDMGSGHTVTALYEVVPIGAPLDVDVGSTPALRYQRVTSAAKQIPDELLNVSVRYKDPDGDRSRLMRQPVAVRSVEASADDRFTMAVAGYAMLLHRSKYVGSFDFDHVIALATSGAGLDSARAEFITMARTTRELAAKAALARRK